MKVKIKKSKISDKEINDLNLYEENEIDITENKTKKNNK